MTDTDPRPASLDGLEIYVEAAEFPIAGGRWGIRAADQAVFYERRPGTAPEPAMVSAETLRSSRGSWTRLDP
ncbi:hypothetical protein [Amycolatopsis nigrescens]|uniref:hypothetical protein n=1 Tax=Amycolatopsis nigrescens TaxID=381445 RepID=UPI00036629B5|nr:hypothetical protein [Amycolatopsis nigrescens]